MIRKEINRISEVGKALISVEGNPGVALNHVVELLEAETNQSLSFAKAINISEDSTRFQVFNGTQGLSTQTKYECTRFRFRQVSRTTCWAVVSMELAT